MQSAVAQDSEDWTVRVCTVPWSRSLRFFQASPRPAEDAARFTSYNAVEVAFSAIPYFGEYGRRGATFYSGRTKNESAQLSLILAPGPAPEHHEDMYVDLFQLPHACCHYGTWTDESPKSAAAIVECALGGKPNPGGRPDFFIFLQTS